MPSKLDAIRAEVADERAHYRPGSWLGDYPLEDLETLIGEIDRLRDALEEIARLGDDTSTEFFNGYLADKARIALGQNDG